MMIPEHVHMVKRIFKDDELTPRPELDPQALDEIGKVLTYAQESKQNLLLTYWDSGTFKTILGRLHAVNAYSKTLRIKDKFEDTITVEFMNVIDARLMED